MSIREEDQQNTPGKVKNVNDDFNQRMAPGNRPDPSAKRNVGKDGALEREGQKDKLENLHIQGNETTGYGANDKTEIESFAQGPGFEYEGSDTAMGDSVNGIRSQDQPLGSDKTKPNDADQSRI
ncbi:hypothetical protein [Pontibacter vulgaris]|uniref:hypothetical protein n=1 Tax=Pontibacter vulgaris TaxID=2905679 RepID=UPI001FA81369|nr:hypothetical protein [Pontibacter vulgaris]